jgi:cell division protein FtsW
MEESLEEINQTSKILIITTLILAVIGVIMVYSSSYILAQELFGNSNYYFFKQMTFLSAGTVIAFIISKTKISFWIKYSHYINWFFTALLLATFFPGFGKIVKGAKRWIDLGLFSFQPGELVKYTVLLSSISLFDNFLILEKKDKINRVVGLLAPLFLLLLQPDFGSFSICLIIIAYACFLSDFPRKVFYCCFGFAITAAIPILISQPYRVKRLFTFLDPWKNPQTSGFQIIQSYLGFANGSIFGVGLGNSNEKLFYLPEAHNDFIFSVIGEELGFVGVSTIVILFFTFAVFGQKLALLLPKKSNSMVVSCVIFLITLQASLNMGVVLGLLPTKGLNLPFISSGGSSLLANAFGIGLVLSALNSYRKTISSQEAFYPNSSAYENPLSSSSPPVDNQFSASRLPR